MRIISDMGDYLVMHVKLGITLLKLNTGVNLSVK